MKESVKYENWPHQQLTGQIIKAFFQVYNTLGEGFLEKVYERAMVVELRSMGLLVQQQQPIKVHYRYQIVGDYFADLIVGAPVIVELKAAEGLCDADTAQVVNYLRATPIEVGLLLNFGPKPDIKRKLYTNDRKKLGPEPIEHR